MDNSTFIAEQSHSLHGTSHSSPALWTPTENQWELYQPIILSLYSKGEHNLPDVIKEMRRRYGFNATTDQYKHQIHRKWKMSGKNHTEDEMRAMAIITAFRARSGKESHFRLRGKYITPQEVRRYWQRKKMTIMHAAATTVHVPYPPGLECVPVTEMNSSPSAPKSFSQAEQLFWYSRKFAASWDGTTTSGYCDPDLSKFVRFFAASLHQNLIAKNAALAKACVTIQENQSNFAWTFAFICSAMSDFETPGFVELVNQVVLKTPVQYRQTRKILQDLNEFEPQIAKTIAFNVVDLCIQTVIESLSPLDSRAFGLAISYAWLTGEFTRLRNIMQSYERVMETREQVLPTTALFQLATSNKIVGEQAMAHQLFLRLLRPPYSSELTMYMFPEIFTYFSTSDLAWANTVRPPMPMWLFAALPARVCYEFTYMQSAASVAMVSNHTEDLLNRGLAVESRLMEEFDGAAFRQAFLAIAEIYIAIEDNNFGTDGSLAISTESREWFTRLREWIICDNPEVADELVLP